MKKAGCRPARRNFDMENVAPLNPPSTSIARELDEIERADLTRLEIIVDRGLTGFVEVGNALLEISDRLLYRETHSTFEEYCREKWKMTARRAYQLCEAAEVVTSLPENVNNCSHSLITNEGQARELAKIAPMKRARVLKTAATKGRVTAKSIKEAADQMVTSFKCDGCEETFEDATGAEPLYECQDCGDRFTRANSADAAGHRCPSCNKFGSKVSDMGCPSCGEGELQQAEPEPEEPPRIVAHPEFMKPDPPESIGGINVIQYFAVKVGKIVDEAIAAKASIEQLKALSLACQVGAKRASEAAKTSGEAKT
jgi:hypothetical protein